MAVDGLLVSIEYSIRYTDSLYLIKLDCVELISSGESAKMFIPIRSSFLSVGSPSASAVGNGK